MPCWDMVELLLEPEFAFVRICCLGSISTRMMLYYCCCSTLSGEQLNSLLEEEKST